MNLDWPEFSKLLVVFMSGVISTYIAHLLSSYREKKKNVREEKRETRQVKVIADIEIIAGPKPLPAAMQIVVTAVNVGYRPITIVNAGLILEGNEGRTISHFGISSNHVPWPSLPKTISDGEAIKFYMDLSWALRFVEEFRKISDGELLDASITSIFVKDAEGIEYISELPYEKKLMMIDIATGKLPAIIQEE